MHIIVRYANLGVALLLAGVPAAGGAPESGSVGPQRVVLAIQNTECARCAAALTASLKKVPGVTAVQVSPAMKRAVVTYDPARASLQQVAEAVAGTAGLHGKPYDANLLVRLAPYDEKLIPQVEAACKSVKGVAGCAVLKPEAGNERQPGLIGVSFLRLMPEPNDQPPFGAQLEPLLKAIRAATMVRVEVVR